MVKFDSLYALFCRQSGAPLLIILTKIIDIHLLETTNTSIQTAEQRPKCEYPSSAKEQFRPVEDAVASSLFQLSQEWQRLVCRRR